MPDGTPPGNPPPVDELELLEGATATPSPASAGTEPGGPARGGGPLAWLSPGRGRALVRWESALFVALALVVVWGVSIHVPPHGKGFLSDYYLFSMTVSNGDIAIMALPLMFIIVTGEIDLSVASMLGMANAVMGELWSHGWPLPLIFLMVLLVGIAAGAFNGFLITKVGLPSLAVTIGTLTLYRGIDEIILRSNLISNFPTFWTNIGIKGIPGISWLSWSAAIFIVLAVIFGIVLHLTPFGRSLFAIGANKEAAAFAGIRVLRVKFFLYVLSGIICSLDGIIYTFRTFTAESDSAVGLELNVVVMVLLGGISIFGGTGTILGVVLSVFVIAGVQAAALLAGFNGLALPMIPGVLLLLSVLLPNMSAFRLRARDSVRRYQTRLRVRRA